MNQIEASFWKGLGAYDNRSIGNYYFDHFIGSRGKDNSDDQDFIGISVMTKDTRQVCNDLFISISFRGKVLSWRDFTDKKGEDSKFRTLGPAFYPTDFGACCLFVPHIDFETFGENISFIEKYHGLDADSLNGENNGLKILLDAEEFNYEYHR